MRYFVKIIAFFVIWGILFMLQPLQSFAENNSCSNFRSGAKVFWRGLEVEPKQEGIVTIQKKTALLKLEGNKKVKIGYANQGEKYRVYSVDSNEYLIGHNLYINKDNKVIFEVTPKKLLENATCSAIYEEKLQKDANQKIVVKGSTKLKTAATLSKYEKRNGKWVKVGASIPAIVGKLGIGKTKEGDSKSPKGSFLLGNSFGWGNKPADTTYPFRKVTKYDYWIDDVKSKDYNKWVSYKGNPSKRWGSFERLNHPLYKYAVIIKYNDSPIIKGEGSAIFLHIKRPTSKYTLGCVAIDEKELVKIIKWLDTSKKPIITIE